MPASLVYQGQKHSAAQHTLHTWICVSILRNLLAVAVCRSVWVSHCGCGINAHGGVLVQIDKLELLESAGATSSSIDVSWRPPTKNKDRITGYKLMLSSSTGQPNNTCILTYISAASRVWALAGRGWLPSSSHKNTMSQTIQIYIVFQAVLASLLRPGKCECVCCCLYVCVCRCCA